MATNDIYTISNPRKDLTAEYLRSKVTYDPISGEFTWLPIPDSFRSGQWNKRRAGKRAGGSNGVGYIVLGFNKVVYLAHRLAWLYMTGGWPVGVIDHINGNRADNRWENLRCCTHAENLHNRAAQRNNSHGFKGITKVKGRWRAVIRANTVHHHLGYFDTPEEAEAAYCAAAKRVMGEYTYVR